MEESDQNIGFTYPLYMLSLLSFEVILLCALLNGNQLQMFWLKKRMALLLVFLTNAEFCRHWRDDMTGKMRSRSWESLCR